MRILHIAKYYYPSRGGMESYVKQLCEGLSRNGYDISVLTINSIRSAKSNWEMIDGIRIRRSKCNLKILSQPISFSFIYDLIKLVSIYEIIHVHSPFPNAELLLPLFHKKKIIITWCADPTKTRWKWIFFIYRPFVKYLLNTAFRIVPISPQLKANSPTLKAFINKCQAINLSFRQNNEITKTDAVRKSPKNPPTVLFVGKLRKYKGVQYLIRAINVIHNTNLVIIGDGEQLGKLKHLTKELGLCSRVLFYTDVSDNELAKYYLLADLFVLPSINEGEAFGIVQLEAMQYGLPVINTRLKSGVPYISIDGQTGLTVAPKDINALANAIKKILNNFVLYEKFSSQAVVRAQLYDENSMIEAYANVYKECALVNKRQ